MGELDVGIQVKRRFQTRFISYRLYIHNWGISMKVYEISTFQVRESSSAKWVADVIKPKTYTPVVPLRPRLTATRFMEPIISGMTGYMASVYFLASFYF